MHKRIPIVAAILAALFTAFALAACGSGSSASSPKPAVESDKQYETNLLQTLRQRYPLPSLTDSSDLKNQIQYATVQSDPNKIEYLVLLGINGNPIGTYTIKGQVSAESTRITAPTKQVCDYSGDTGDSCTEEAQPDLTGTYFSQSGGGYFAYLTDGALIQWGASVGFLTSDQPFHITTPVQLNVNENAAITATHPHIHNGLKP